MGAFVVFMDGDSISKKMPKQTHYSTPPSSGLESSQDPEWQEIEREKCKSKATWRSSSSEPRLHKRSQIMQQNQGSDTIAKPFHRSISEKTNPLWIASLNLPLRMNLSLNR